jgi:predicted nucleotidyltransferase
VIKSKAKRDRMYRSNLCKRSDENLIEKTVRDLEKIKDIFAIILFGSYAKGEQKPISDIDICVVTRKNIPEEMKGEICSYGSDKVEISLFWDLPPAVRYAVLKEGKILFNRNEEFMHAATVETMSEYLDFRWIIDRNIARVFGNE